MQTILKVGDRVRVIKFHRWLPEWYGTIKQVEERTGNRFLVKFDRDEVGMWHDEDGDPVLRLGEKDIALVPHFPAPFMEQYAPLWMSHGSVC